MELVGTFLGIVGAVAAAIGVAVVIRQRQLSLPTLWFGFGLSEAFLQTLPKRYRGLLPGTVVYGLAGKGQAKFILGPLLNIRNSGKAALHNVTIQLEYPREFGISESMLEEVVSSAGSGLKIGKADIRDSQLLGGCRQTRINLGTLRPKENLGTAEPILVLRGHRGRTGPREQEFQRVSEACARESDDFVSLCPIRIFIYCDELEPVQRNLLLIAVSGDSLHRVRQAIEGVVRAFWGGDLPRPGLHFKFPWENFIEDRIAPVFVPRMRRAGRGVLIEVLPPEYVEGGLKLSLPGGKRVERLFEF